MPKRFSHLDYYSYQGQARGISCAADVHRDATNKAYIYDQLLHPRLPVNRDARIVELACGHGAFLIWAKERGWTNITGVDSSPEQTAAAQAAGGKAIMTDVISWLDEQPRESVSTIVAIDLAEHLSKDDFLTVLHSAREVLTPDGLMILRLPNGDTPFFGINLFNDITHVWCYTSNCLETLAHMAGFSSALFHDEGWRVARDFRWMKLPLGWFCETLAAACVRILTRERVRFWSPHLWAFLSVSDRT